MDVPSGQVLCTYHQPLIGHSSFKNKGKTLKLDLLKMYRTIKAQVRLYAQEGMKEVKAN